MERSDGWRCGKGISQISSKVLFSWVSFNCNFFIHLQRQEIHAHIVISERLPESKLSSEMTKQAKEEKKMAISPQVLQIRDDSSVNSDPDETNNATTVVNSGTFAHFACKLLFFVLLMIFLLLMFVLNFKCINQQENMSLISTTIHRLIHSLPVYFHMIFDWHFLFTFLNKHLFVIHTSE